MPAPAAVVAQPNADAELIQLGAEFSRLQAAIDRLEEGFFTLPRGHADLEATDKQVEALVIQQGELTDRMCEIPAWTQAGVLAKAGMARALFLRHHKEEIEGDFADEDVTVAWSVISDLLTVGGRA